jgi:hypothetical protein
MASTPGAGTAIELRRWLLRTRDEGSLGRRPLGEREAVAAVLGDCLPRLAFDAAGKGVYTRGKAELMVQLVGRPVMAVELTMRAEQAGAFRPALERITTIGGWQLFDPDRGEVVFPPEPVGGRDGSGGGRAALKWAVPLVVTVALVAWAGGWIPGRSKAQTARAAAPAGTRDVAAAQKMLENMLSSMTAVDGAQPAAPVEAEHAASAVIMQVQMVGEFLRRNKLVAPEFRTMQVVNELTMISVAETAFQMTTGGGHFVDPATLANRTLNPPGRGIPVLPETFAASERGGYRFAFTGYDELPSGTGTLKPLYKSYLYVAWPLSDEPGTYTFALRGDTGHIHYTTDGRSPAATDPKVVESADGEGPK